MEIVIFHMHLLIERQQLLWKWIVGFELDDWKIKWEIIYTMVSKNHKMTLGWSKNNINQFVGTSCATPKTYYLIFCDIYGICIGFVRANDW